MNFSVHVKGPGYSDRAELRDDRAECHYGQPVLVLRGQAVVISELPPGSRIVVTWHKARTGPVWAIVQKAIDAGYPIDVEL